LPALAWSHSTRAAGESGSARCTECLPPDCLPPRPGAAGPPDRRTTPTVRE
jgi:hypothetical protein